MVLTEEDDYESIYSYSSFQVILWGFTCFYMTSTLVICIWPLWGLMNAGASASTLGPVFGFKGLFVECIQYMSGQYQCDNYLYPVFEQPWPLVFVRTFGVLAMLLACIGTGLCLLGLDCIRVAESDEQNKKKLQRGGVAMLLISGMCMTSICIFYAIVVKREFKWFQNVPEMTVSGDFLKYEYGGCVYAGFILSLLCYILVYFWIQAYFAKKDSNLSMDYSEMDDSSGSEILSQEDKEILRNFKAQKSYPDSRQTRSVVRTMSGFGNDAQAEVNSYKSEESRTAFI